MTQHKTALGSCVLALLVMLGASVSQAQERESPYPDPDRLQLNWDARLVNGFGATVGSLERTFILETAIRGDFLWGKPGDEHFRFGPAFELRTGSFHTLEGGVGGSILLPVFRGYPIVLTSVAGYAFRKSDFGDDGFYVSNTFAWGYRSYNWHARYGVAFNGFITTRHHLDQHQAVEVTGGIELDIELAIGIPARALIMLFRGRDPDEPEDEADDDDDSDDAEEAAEAAESASIGPRRVPLTRAIAF